MPDAIQLKINGRPISVPAGTVVAAAIANAGIVSFRRSVSGQPRGPLCGMGTCLECRVTINSTAAAAALNRAHLAHSANGKSVVPGAEFIDPVPVPEPATLAIWGLGALGAMLSVRVRLPRSVRYK